MLTNADTIRTTLTTARGVEIFRSFNTEAELVAFIGDFRNYRCGIRVINIDGGLTITLAAGGGIAATH